MEDEDLIPTPRKQTFEPKNKYEYCEWMAKITGRRLGDILDKTRGFPLDWMVQIASEVKYERDRAKWPVTINSWLKKSKVDKPS